MEFTLDSVVVDILNGFELGKYVPLFQNHQITFDMFLWLNEDDLRTIGIEDDGEIDRLMQYLKKSRKSKISNKQSLKPLEFNDLMRILTNTEKHLFVTNVACNHVQKKLQLTKPLDTLINDDTTASTVIASLCDRIQHENNTMIEDIDQFLKEIQQKPENPRSLKTIAVTSTTIVILSLAIAIVSFYRRS